MLAQVLCQSAGRAGERKMLTSLSHGTRSQGGIAAVLPWAVILPYCALTDAIELVASALAIANKAEVLSALRLRCSMVAAINAAIQCCIGPYNDVAEILLTNRHIDCVLVLSEELLRRGGPPVQIQKRSALEWGIHHCFPGNLLRRRRFPMMDDMAGVLFTSTCHSWCQDKAVTRRKRLRHRVGIEKGHTDITTPRRNFSTAYLMGEDEA